MLSFLLGGQSRIGKSDEEQSQRKVIKKPFLIVSLDGGGVRGALQCALLGRLFAKYPELEDRVDMYAGSSVGAFLAAGLATREFSEAQKCCTEQQFAAIFAESWSKEASSADGWYSAKYPASPVKEFCGEFFTGQTMRDAKKHLLITSFRVEETSNEEKAVDPLCAKHFPQNRWQPVIYHNLDPKNESQMQQTFVDMLMQTSAAPGFFPMHKKCIDGGLLANNPAMLAVAYAKHFNLIDSLDDVVVLSLGTGKAEQLMAGYDVDADLGKAQWLPQIADILMQANAEAAVLQCAALLGPQRFCRVQPLLEHSIGLDEYRKVPLLKEIAQTIDLTEAERLVESCL